LLTEFSDWLDHFQRLRQKSSELEAAKGMFSPEEVTKPQVDVNAAP
jgi:hypothetical protein